MMTARQKNRAYFAIAAVFSLVCLYFTSFYSYLLFHSLAEIFSVVIAGTVFIITWNGWDYIENNYLKIVGISYLFVGFLDLLHTLAYTGMGVFLYYDYYSPQIWIATRLLESLVFLIAFFALTKAPVLNPWKLVTPFALITVFIILSIFYWHVFPACFVEGRGLTPFKIYMEYVICGLLGLAAVMLWRNRGLFVRKVYLYIMGSIIFSILTELAFTQYVSMYGPANLLGIFSK